MEDNEERYLFIPYNQKLLQRARENRKNPTQAEKRMWDEILSHKSFQKYKFTRQKPIDNFVVDFYCPQLRLVIEIDGESHLESKEYDQARTEVLSHYGLHVVRYANDHVLNNIESVYEDLLMQTSPSPSLSGGESDN